MSWTHPGFAAVASLLGKRIGLSFPPQRRAAAEQGIRRAMSRAGVTDPDRYRTLLETSAAPLDDLVTELTIGETYFFREPAQFEHIRRQVLPDVRSRRGPGHTVRAWSAACASGEEAYSLAIVLAEEGLAARSYVLATDVSRAALAKARRAVYGDWSLRGPGASAAARYLRRRGNLHALDDRIRRAVTFEYLNLALDAYPSFTTGAWGMDLILCRNVLIYFERDAVRAVARRLYETLAPGGWLLTASSDPLLADDLPFETVVTNAGVCYRRPAPALSTVAPGLSIPVPPPVVTAADEAGAAAERSPDPAASLRRVQSLANVEPAEAERACAAAIATQPLAAELHHLHAVLLLELGRDEEAVAAARRVVYLDRSLAVGHFTLGTVLRRRGDLAGARRAYRNAHDLCAARPADEAVPLADGECAGRFAEAAAAQLAMLPPEGQL